MKAQLHVYVLILCCWGLLLSRHSASSWSLQSSQWRHLQHSTSHTSKSTWTTCHQHIQGTVSDDNYNKPEENEQDYYPEFLQQVEETVSRVLVDNNKHSNIMNQNDKDAILSLSPEQRESFGVARCLETRLQAFRRNNDCPRCWLQRAHCICPQCPPLFAAEMSSLPIHRIFVVMHHKEICLAVDTAKLILASFPQQCRLVVAGIGPEYQPSMNELQQALQKETCRVLFPTEDAQTVEELMMNQHKQQQLLSTTTDNANTTTNTIPKWDLVVLDGTWSQAQKMHRRYIPPSQEEGGGPKRIQLSSTSLLPFQQKQQQNDDDASLQSPASSSSSSGHQQLRRHPIDWRTISTMEATRLLLKEIAEQQPHRMDIDDDESTYYDGSIWDTMLQYQSIANNAARRQLGPPRVK